MRSRFMELGFRISVGDWRVETTFPGVEDTVGFAASVPAAFCFAAARRASSTAPQTLSRRKVETNELGRSFRSSLRTLAENRGCRVRTLPARMKCVRLEDFPSRRAQVV